MSDVRDAQQLLLQSIVELDQGLALLEPLDDLAASIGFTVAHEGGIVEYCRQVVRVQETLARALIREIAR